MAEFLLKTDLPREKGYIYFIKNSPLEIWRAQRGRKKKSETKPPVSSEKPPEPEPKEEPEKLKEIKDASDKEEPIPF